MFEGKKGENKTGAKFSLYITTFYASGLKGPPGGI